MAFVHQGSEEGAQDLMGRFGLESVARVSDPDLSLYRAFGLRRMSLLEYLNPILWIRGIYLAFVKKHGHGRSDGDDYQLPGVFLVHRDEIQRSHRYREIWDHPDFAAMAKVGDV